LEARVRAGFEARGGRDADAIQWTQRPTRKKPPKHEDPDISPDATILLKEFDPSGSVRDAIQACVDSVWRPWADLEKLRRKSIRLYSDLFTLKQQLEGSIVESALELVWGIGLGIWNANGTMVSYPLVSLLVELSLNPKKSAIEIRPRDVDPRLEVEWYASVDNPGLSNFEKGAHAFFDQTEVTLSPFDRSTFEPILKLAATTLDSNGIFWPEVGNPADRSLPDPDEKLKVTDSWVIFARPRTVSPFIQDLERLKVKIEEESADLPGSLTSIVVEPAKITPDVTLPNFRGVSAIANVICHYLALGRRILVTSMKDPALKVLQDQLPEDIRLNLLPFWPVEESSEFVPGF